jgi:hypothetical protein
MGENTMGRIFVPKPLADVFSVEDFWIINTRTRLYDVSVVLRPLYQTHNTFHLSRVV